MYALSTDDVTEDLKRDEGNEDERENALGNEVEENQFEDSGSVSDLSKFVWKTIRIDDWCKNKNGIVKLKKQQSNQ